MPDLRIFFHDNCFDGASSAALFAEFFVRARRPGADIDFAGVQHRTGDPFVGLELAGADNACVDFRYSPDPAMTWWFDHHASAFQPAGLRDHFAAHPSEQKVFDPTASSCALLIDRELAARFEFEWVDPDGHWAELIAWADRIDAARFASAAEAAAIDSPAMQLSTWLAHNREPELTDRLIRMLGRRPLAEIAGESWIAAPLAPLIDRHHANIELIRERAEISGGGDVVCFDLSNDDVWAPNNFIAYMLFPEARYTIGVTRGAGRAKVSVGSNPWAPRPRAHNIAAICERYGGGGHPMVGAVSLADTELERIREIANEIAAELAV